MSISKLVHWTKTIISQFIEQEAHQLVVQAKRHSTQKYLQAFCVIKRDLASNCRRFIRLLLLNDEA